MAQIKYATVKTNGLEECTDKCPHDKTTRIGSSFCKRLCGHCKSYSDEENWVDCNREASSNMTKK